MHNILPAIFRPSQMCILRCVYFAMTEQSSGQGGQAQILSGQEIPCHGWSTLERDSLLCSIHDAGTRKSWFLDCFLISSLAHADQQQPFLIVRKREREREKEKDEEECILLLPSKHKSTYCL